MEKENENNFLLIDTLSSEYGWTIEYIQTLSPNEILGLIEKINERKKIEWKILCYIINCAMNGKQPKLDNDKKEVNNVDEETLRRLMTSLGGKIEEVNR